MANNRMWLRNKVTGEQVLLAKYYPSTGWYCFHDELNLKLDGLFRNPENIDGSPTGRTDYEVAYESEADTDLEAPLKTMSQAEYNAACAKEKALRTWEKKPSGD